jgi:prevent-host-death family protein
MDSVNATDLKNRLGPVLARASLGTVAIVRHGRVVAYLVPPDRHGARKGAPKAPRVLDRAAEERLLSLAASRDLRPSRWQRAGDPWLLAGVATMLASQPEFDRVRLLALAERLHPGMSTTEEFGRWLERSPLRPARFLPMLRKEMSMSRA